MSSPLLQIAGVSKRFGAARAVEDVSFEVGEGEVLGLLGPNGAGKSTTLRIIAGLVRPDAGAVSIGGHDVASARRRALAAAGFLIETPALPPELSCRKALRYLELLDGRPSVSGATALAEVGLAESADKPVRHLSLGMKQRLGIAAALMGRPRVLVLDEPMNGLDPAGIREMGDLVRRLAGGGAAVLVSSHLLDEVERIADRVAIMFRGTLAAVERVSAGSLAERFFAITGRA